MESSDLYNQNQLIAFLNSRYSKSLAFSASYVLNYARSNSDGLGTFPAKPYDCHTHPPSPDIYRRRQNQAETKEKR